MSKYVIDSETLTDIADAIRAKTGDSASMTPLEMPDEIASISGGGGTVGRIVKHVEVIPTSTLTNANRLTVQLNPSSYSAIVVVVNEYPQPNQSGSTALFWARTTLSLTVAGIILRSDGTIGTDPYMCDFNSSTGSLKIGGTYGNFFAGTKYDVYQIDMEVV